jgi:hypothetical protein
LKASKMVDLYQSEGWRLLWDGMSRVFRLVALQPVSKENYKMNISPSSSLVTTPVLIGKSILLLPPVVAVEDNWIDDDFAFPLVRALQPAGVAAQADVCTGK